MSASHFQRGHGVFDCESCGRKTRGTPDSVTLGFCEQCDFLFADDNMHNDDGTTPDAKERAHYDRLLAQIETAGGDADKVRGYCSFLFA